MRRPLPTPYTYDYTAGARIAALLIALLCGAPPVLAYFGVVTFHSTRKSTAIFEDPRHWPVLVFGLTFLLIGIQFNIPKECRRLLSLNGTLILLGLATALGGTVLFKLSR
jgi:hypothetical protein